MKEGTGISPELESTAAIIEGMGYSVVEAAYRPLRSSVQVSIFIYRPDGVTLEDCTEVYRTVMPRLEVALEQRSINLEISSPGISRTIKHFGEFAVFAGRRVRIMQQGENEWREGKILSADSEKVVIATDGGEEQYECADIIKAKISEG